ncbi:hypothetical protein EZS27_034090 [termite gut metagenome]|uniref:Uncharacterized protein n=1 Tax=termite gut metagenome TaxID=433724 RepID=A0A5J4Q337_9ZZZZ
MFSAMFPIVFFMYFNTNPPSNSALNLTFFINTEAQRHGESTNSVPLSLCVKTNLDDTILIATWYKNGLAFASEKQVIKLQELFTSVRYLRVAKKYNNHGEDTLIGIKSMIYI